MALVTRILCYLFGIICFAATPSVSLHPAVAEVGQDNLTFMVTIKNSTFDTTAIATVNESPRTSTLINDTTLSVALYSSDLTLSPKPTISVTDSHGAVFSTKLTVYPTCGAEVNYAVNPANLRIAAYSNGVDTGSRLGASCGDLATSWHPAFGAGLYQCVDLAKRYYQGLLGPSYNSLTWQGDPVGYWYKYQSMGLVEIINDGTQVPQVGDLVIFQDINLRDKNGNPTVDTTGHVAIVTNVSVKGSQGAIGDSITLMEQNWDGTGRGTLVFDSNGKATRPGNYAVLGWLRSASSPPGSSGTSTITVSASLDNVPSWSGTVGCQLTGPTGLSIGAVPVPTFNAPPGAYSLSCSSGGPPFASLSSITPNPTQILSANGTMTFTLNYVSTACHEETPQSSSRLMTRNSFLLSSSASTCSPPLATPLFLSCSCAPNPTNIGGISFCSSQTFGGTPPFQYLWSSQGSSIGTLSAVSTSYSVIGTYIVNLSATDSSQPFAQVKSTSCSLEVTSPPSPTLSISGVSTSSALPVGSTGGLVQISATYTNVPPNSTISQTVTGLPSGVTASSSSQTVSGSGTVTLSSNYTVSSGAQPGNYSPIATVSVAGIVKTLTASLQITAPPQGTINVLATMNGQPYSGAVACGFLNSPSNILVNAVPFSQSNLPLGAYSLNCAGGPPNSQLQSFSPSSSQTLTAGATITFTAAYVWAPVTVYSNPLPSPGSGSWTWDLSAWTASGNGTWITQPVLNFAGANYAYSHPEQYVLALQQIMSLGATGPLSLFISQFQAILPSWPPYVIVSSPTSAPTVTGYFWNNTPQNRVLFSGNISGTGFVSGNSAVYFCVSNTTTCYQQPAVGVVVNSPISLSVYNVNLTSGSWQVMVVTPYGNGIGPAFVIP